MSHGQLVQEIQRQASGLTDEPVQPGTFPPNHVETLARRLTRQFRTRVSVYFIRAVLHQGGAACM